MAHADLLLRVERLVGHTGGSTRVEVESLLTDATAVQVWLDARSVALMRNLNELAAADGSLLPEDVVARAGALRRRDADALARRTEVLDALPAFDAALSSGTITAEHVDILERATRRLPRAEKAKVADRHERLAELAARSTPDEFIAVMKGEVARVQHDEGAADLSKQRENTALASFIDPVTGMVHLRGQFDPERGGRLLGRLRNELERLFHDALPDDCPTDARKQDHLRALALLSLTDSTPNTSSGGHAEIVVVIDEATARNGRHEHTQLWVSNGVELAMPSIRRLMCEGTIVPVIVDANGVVLNVGRTQRLATRAQRRALRAMYATCGVPGCEVAYDHCQPHHIHWWEHGGPTDLVNLIPLCSKHHHAVHDRGWVLLLDPSTRALTIVLPDGTTMATGPPRARAG